MIVDIDYQNDRKMLLFPANGNEVWAAESYLNYIAYKYEIDPEIIQDIFDIRYDLMTDFTELANE